MWIPAPLLRIPSGDTKTQRFLSEQNQHSWKQFAAAQLLESAHSRFICVCPPHRASADCVRFPPEPAPPPSGLVLRQKCQDVSMFGESGDMERAKRANSQTAGWRAKKSSSPSHEAKTVDNLVMRVQVCGVFIIGCVQIQRLCLLKDPAYPVCVGQVLCRLLWC